MSSDSIVNQRVDASGRTQDDFGTEQGCEGGYGGRRPRRGSPGTPRPRSRELYRVGYLVLEVAFRVPVLFGQRRPQLDTVQDRGPRCRDLRVHDAVPAREAGETASGAWAGGAGERGHVPRPVVPARGYRGCRGAALPAEQRAHRPQPGVRMRGHDHAAPQRRCRRRRWGPPRERSRALERSTKHQAPVSVRAHCGSARRTFIAPGPPRGTSSGASTSTRGAPAFRSLSAGCCAVQLGRPVSTLLTLHRLPSTRGSLPAVPVPPACDGGPASGSLRGSPGRRLPRTCRRHG